MERQHPSQLQVEGDCTSYHVCYFIRTHLRGFTAPLLSRGPAFARVHVPYYRSRVDGGLGWRQLCSQGGENTATGSFINDGDR